jgi:hypothetical protein
LLQRQRAEILPGSINRALSGQPAWKRNQESRAERSRRTIHVLLIARFFKNKTATAIHTSAARADQISEGRWNAAKMIFRLSFAITVGVLLSAAARGQANDEYQLKAAFLYNISKFVEWPPRTFKGVADPLEICVLGKDPFGTSLRQAVNGKTILGKPFTVFEILDVQHASGCNILFIARSERKSMRSILDAIRGTTILTVGESEGFASEGGMINFKIDAGRVRLQINVDSADQAKLAISSKLLSLAEIVKEQK